MAYQTPFHPQRADKCAAEAIARLRGEYPLGHAFRLMEVSYSTVIDADAEIYGSDLVVEIEAFGILRRTAKGFWIANNHGKRFVLLAANKRYALPTVAEAVESYVARKTRQAAIYEARAATARRCIAAVQSDCWLDAPKQDCQRDQTNHGDT